MGKKIGKEKKWGGEKSAFNSQNKQRVPGQGGKKKGEAEPPFSLPLGSS